MKRCNACKASYRGAGARVYVPRAGQLVRTNVCPTCADAAIAVLVSAPTRDARICEVCRLRPAVACESCMLAARTVAAKAARAAVVREYQQDTDALERAERAAARSQ